MCGITLQFYKNGRPDSDRGSSVMLNELTHRGKDQVSNHCYTNCKVGFRRLAITDIDTAQPGAWVTNSVIIEGDGTQWTDRNLWEVWLNGEIYNYKALGFEGSECEVLAQGFGKYGCDFVKQLDGMFVIVAIEKGNSQNPQVYVFTDRWKQKPLYWFETATSIILASECKALIAHPDYHFAVNENAKTQLLTFSNIFTDETLFEGIHRLGGGISWHLNSGKKTKYWCWQYTPIIIDYQEAKEEVRRLVEQAVSSQTPQEVSYGSCLSGGIDSGIITALLGDCKTFTVGYKGQPDERLLAELLGKQQYEIVYDKPRNLQETIYALENPVLGESWMHWQLYELASKFVKVLFDGAGSDELFFSYHWRYSEADYWNVLNRTGIDNHNCRKVFKQVFPVDTLEARRVFDAEHFLGGVLSVVDKLSMNHTIEVRTPFLSNPLVDFVNTLPFEYRENKRILKDAFADLLPPEILNAPKRGFSTPKNWIHGEHNQARNWVEKSLNIWEEMFNLA